MLAAAAGLLGAGWLPTAPPAGAAPAGNYQNPLTRDAPDPDVVYSGGTYYAFATTGNFEAIQLFESTDLAHWTPQPWPGALVAEPAWASPGEEWAPSVAEVGGAWLMYYATFDIQNQVHCISVAVSETGTVAGPYADHSSGPIVCQSALGGDLDPDAFFDADGTPYLVWKSNPGPASPVAYLWSQRLSSDGRSFAPNALPHVLIAQDQAWESTIENPDLVLDGGHYYLFYSGGAWENSSYSIGYAVCDGPSGPCAKPYDHAIMRSTGGVVGPGGDWAFSDAYGQWWMAYAAWTAGAVGYPVGARSMRLDPLCFTGGGQGPANPVAVGPTTTPGPLAQTCPALDPNGQYRMVAADGGVFSYGNASFYGSAGGQRIPAPVIAAATDPATTGYWEVGFDGSVYAFGAPFFGQATGQLGGKVVTAMAATPDGGGYWLVAYDGSVYAYGDASYLGGMAGQRLNNAIVGMATTPDGGGYWLVAADGGVFAFGDAKYEGSMGGEPLNARIVGLAATPDGNGYWLVAADGGVFAFGDAPFHGSAGALPLAKPIVGMAVTGAGGGYWLVAADGGVFSYGAAPYWGSTGWIPLNRPMVAVMPG